MSSSSAPEFEDNLEALYRDMEAENVDALWRREGELLTREPAKTGLPYHWEWEKIESLLLRAGQLVQLGSGGERRVLRLVNPSLEAPASTTHTISSTLQLLLPGESAPLHRHSAAAIRFIISGRGAFTEVEGERIEMEPGDLILTPNWTWHSHHNPTNEQIIWMDIIDTPMVLRLKAMFFESGRNQQVQEKPVGYTVRRSNKAGMIRPELLRNAAPVQGGALPLIYRWAEVEPIFQEQGAERSPYDGDLLRYANPLTGDHHTLPTMGCAIQRLHCGEQTLTHRHLSSTVYYVMRGQGMSTVEGKEIRWRQGDVITIPTWAWHSHNADQEAILFSISDQPAMEKLGWYREEAAE